MESRDDVTLFGKKTNVFVLFCFRLALSLLPSNGKLMKHLNARYHILAIVVSALWGTTFVSSKVLIIHGLSPQEIMLLRFVVAYICMIGIAHKRLFANSLKDELLLVGLGVTGGSFYFMAENTALQYTQACNVSILISITPLLTSLTAAMLYKAERITRNLILGAGLAMTGVTLVVLNGHFVLKLNPFGDLLVLFAALMWVAYTIIFKKLGDCQYSMAFLTRKVFFYGIITILPFFPIMGVPFRVDCLMEPTVLFNLLYLGLLASFLGYLGWNFVVNNLGAVVATNYLYINPLATFVTSAIFLQEQVTYVGIIGGVLILGGVYFSQKRTAI